MTSNSTTNEAYREFLKANAWEQQQNFRSDQQKGVPVPPLQKPYPEDATLIDLVPPEEITVGEAPLKAVVADRESRRRFTEEALTLEELSFLLWATQGVRDVLPGGRALLRTVPSAGARHAFETYLFIHRAEELERGLYRYLSLEHKLYFLYDEPDLAERVSDACYGQRFVGNSAVAFIWAALPYRMEWRYSILSPKLIALDAGHVCQNLYLACEALGLGTCAIGAYHQAKMDAVLGVDGEDEFAVYVAPVGKITQEA
jgi:SagB-type dehydrogenase family enzyme